MDDKEIRSTGRKDNAGCEPTKLRRALMRERGGSRVERKHRWSTQETYKSGTAGVLNYVQEESMEWMARGDILLLHETGRLREVVDSAFFAILACPTCGKLDLVTLAQYSGIDTVICGYEDCACHFRINHRREISFLPVN